MTTNDWLIIAILVTALVALVGFFLTKSNGFGRFSTSTLLLLLVVAVSSLLFASGKMEGTVVANILFAVIGFAGGLFTAKDETNPANKASGKND